MSVRTQGVPYVWRSCTAPEVVIFKCLFWKRRGSVWPFMSFMHILGILEVPALLVLLPKDVLLRCLYNLQGRNRGGFLCCASIIAVISLVFFPHLRWGCDAAALHCLWRGCLSFHFYKLEVWLPFSWKQPVPLCAPGVEEPSLGLRLHVSLNCM